MITCQLMSFEKRILASFVAKSKENQVDLYRVLIGLPETSAPLILALEQVFEMLNGHKVTT